MNDTERRLAAWLQEADPQPPRLLTFADIVAAADIEPHPVRPASRRPWLPLLTAAVVVIVIAGVLTALAITRHNGHTAPATSKTPTHTSSTSAAAGIAEPPSDFDETRLVGSAGRFAWKLTNILRVSSDGAAHWTTLTLPGGLTPDAIDQLQVGADGTVFLIHEHAKSYDVYRRPAAATQWAKTTLTPIAPNDANPFLVVRGDARLVVIVAGWVTEPTHAFTDLFVSTDGGASFTQRPTGLQWQVSDLLFLDDKTGFVIAGPADNLVYRTTDGGKHWRQILGGPVTADKQFGPLTQTDGAVVIPQITGSSRAANVQLLRSVDEGAHFEPVAVPLRRPVEDPQSVSVLDHTVWVVSGTYLYRSSDDGRTWTATSLTQQFRNLELAGPSAATGISGATCSSNEPTGCRTTDYLVVTTDAGRTWHTA